MIRNTVKPVCGGHCIGRSSLFYSQVTKPKRVYSVQFGLRIQAMATSLQRPLSRVPRITTVDRTHCIIQREWIGTSWGFPVTEKNMATEF